MNYALKFFLFLLAIICLFSCRPNRPVDCVDIPCDTTDHTLKSRLDWSQPIAEDTTEMIIGEIIASKSLVVYLRYKEGHEKTIIARDVETGKVLWEWGDVNAGSGFLISDIALENDHLIVQSWQDIFVVNATNGKTIWHTDIKQMGDCASPRISVINSNIYFTTNDCSNPRNYCRLWRTPVSHFFPEPVYQIDRVESPQKDSGWISSIEPPVLWMHPAGDSVLVFQSRAFRKGVLANKADLFAYNLKTESLLWKIDSITREGYSVVHPPAINNNSIYQIGNNSIQKVDALTGKVIWSKSFTGSSEQFIYANITISRDNKIYTQPGADFLYALDAETGNQIWKSKIACCGVTGAVQWIDFHLYYVSPPYFFDIDAIAGSIKNQFSSPLYKGTYNTRFSQFAQSVQIPDEKKIITFDSHYIMAIRVDE